MGSVKGLPLCNNVSSGESAGLLRWKDSVNSAGAAPVTKILTLGFECWISDAEIARVSYTAFVSKPKSRRVTASLIVRRVKRLGDGPVQGQGELFTTYRFHAVFTDSLLPLIAAESAHRGHAVVEQVIADPKGSALAHLPSGRFHASAAWLHPAPAPSAPTSSRSPPAWPAAVVAKSGICPRIGTPKVIGSICSLPCTYHQPRPDLSVHPDTFRVLPGMTVERLGRSAVRTICECVAHPLGVFGPVCGSMRSCTSG